ncbi:MAG TPA: carbohydrate-binding family 9-like protein [Pyrinomonadaceae bacterium]|nr:carbohydrate-binding family 9-like protein [Pyrinomonadaceae bacterium]
MKTKLPVLLMALVMLTATVISSSGQIPDVPVYEVSRTATPIKVDGKLNDAVWTKARQFRDFRLNLDGSLSPYKTEVRSLYDDTFLYFSFRTLDDNIWATLRTRDQHLWEEEVVEVFLQADPQQANYIELEVNPLGTMLDIYLLDIRKPLRYESWNSQQLEWAVQVFGTVDGRNGDREWTCEIALPLADIVTAKNLPPKNGDRWRLNLYRVEMLPNRVSLAWSPTFNDDFHLPGKFGELVFTDHLIR